MNWKKYAYGLVLALVCVCTVLGCLFLYKTDNKYTREGPQGKHGILLLGEGLTEEQPLVFLTRGWEYYHDRLLTPEDIGTDPPIPDEYVFLGQYGGFDRGGRQISSHGSASYRLTVVLPVTPQAYCLELPEIFSAYRLYVNGVELTAMGIPEPEGYRPETGNRSVAFEASGSVELLLAVSDYSHIYSGTVYPPAFGDADAVAKLLAARVLFRGGLVAVAATVGLLALLIGLAGRAGRQILLFSLLCLLFIWYIGYPVIHTFAKGASWLYLLENLSFCAMLLVAMLLQQRITNDAGKLPYWTLRLAALMCGVSVLLRLFAPLGGTGVIRAYSASISLYEWAAAFYLTVSAIRALRRGMVQSKVLLCGGVVLDAALVMDRFLPMHEPIVTGWFVELASFALVLLIGAAVGLEVARQYLENALLREEAAHMEQLSSMQRDAYALLQEQIDHTLTARHDLRHHLVAIGGMVEQGQYDRLAVYLEDYTARLPASEAVRYCDNGMINIIVQYYAHLASMHGIQFRARIVAPPSLPLTDGQLAALLGNLLENAVESCRKIVEGDRRITLSISHTRALLTIHLENTTDGVPPGTGEAFLSSKRPGRVGKGLASVESIAESSGGEAEFRFQKETEMFSSTVLLRIWD